MLSKKSEEFLWLLRTTLMERGKEDSTINEIEDEFYVKIETEDGIKTVQDLVTYVEKQTA